MKSRPRSREEKFPLRFGLKRSINLDYYNTLRLLMGSKAFVKVSVKQFLMLRSLRYLTVTLLHHNRRGWWLSYHHETSTGPFPTKQKAIKFFLNQGR